MATKLMVCLVLAMGMMSTSLFAADLPCEVSWVANSLSGKPGWIQQDIEGIAVTADGTVFTNVPWDEGGNNVEQFVAGQLVRAARHTHGWGYEGGVAVAANSRYVFIAQKSENEGGGLKGPSWPPKGMLWSGVSRRRRDDISKPAPFEGGRGGDGDTLKGAFLPIVEFPEKTPGNPGISGLAASDTQLYVACSSDNTIKIYDAETLKLETSWELADPGKLSLDPAGEIYVIQRKPGAPAIVKLSADGQVIKTLVMPTDSVPLDICVAVTGKVLVSDGGPAQQISMFDAELKPTGTMGVAGGVMALPTPGAFGDLRFNKPKGIGIDAQGNVYVASSGSVAGGSTVLECYGPDLKLRWRQMGLTFVDLVDLDPGDETALYSKDKRFTLDYSQPIGQQWTYTGYTVNALKYPDDPRLHTGPTHVWVRRVGGQPLLFVTDMTSEFLSVYRYDRVKDGYTAIPAALFSRHHVKAREDGWPANQPAADAWAWIDANGNGRMDADEFIARPGAGGIFWPDANGGIWQERAGAIAYLPFDKFTDAGTPTWAMAKARTLPNPAEFTAVRRVHYQPELDLLVLAGNNGTQHNQHWKPMGPILATYDHALSGTPTLRWKTLLPYEVGSSGHESKEPISFDVAGDYVFVAYTRGLAVDHVKFAYIKVYSLADGALVGNLISEHDLGECGLLDLVDSVRAVRRGNGEYVVFLEDDMKAKVIMFRWQPAGAAVDKPAN